MPSSVFVSYSHRDENWKDTILTHLASAGDQLSIRVWDDTYIPFGSEWAANLKSELASCEVAILLLSADFLSSAFIRDVEAPMLLAQETAGETKLLPILLRPCAWQTVPWLANRAIYPAKAGPLSTLTAAEIETQIAIIVGELSNRAMPPPGIRDYLIDRLYVEGPDQARFELTNVPTSTRVADVARAVLGEYDPKIWLDSSGKPRRAVIDRVAAGGSTRLRPDSTLYEQNILEGETVHVAPESTAGCFPLDAQIARPDGSTTSLAELQVGDSVESPAVHGNENIIALIDEIIRERAERLVVINDSIRITADQGVFCISRGSRWIPAGKLHLGDVLLLGDRRTLSVVELRFNVLEVEVGNLILRHPAHAFIADRLVVFGAQRTDFGALSKVQMSTSLERGSAPFELTSVDLSAEPERG